MKKISVFMCVCMIFSSMCICPSAFAAPLGQTEALSYDFQKENPFGEVSELVRPDTGSDNLVYSLADGSSALLTLSNPVSDGVFVMETDVYIDYDGTSNGMSTIRLDNGTSSERIQLFTVSKTGNPVSANGAFGSTAFADESWYRIKLAVNAGTKTMTAQYALIGNPGESGDFQDVIFSVKNSDSVSEMSAVYPFDERNNGATFPSQIKRLLINSARAGINDYFDNLALECYAPLYSVVSAAADSKTAENAVNEYYLRFDSPLVPASADTVDTAGMYEWLAKQSFDNDADLLEIYNKGKILYSKRAGKQSSYSFDFEKENPFGSANGSLIRSDSESDNQVFSLTSGKSAIYTFDTVTDGVLVIETDIYADYASDAAGTPFIRVDDTGSDSKYRRMGLFQISKNGKAVAENGEEGTTVFEDESWYRIRLVINAKDETMTASYMPIDKPGGSGEWSDVVFCVKTASGKVMSATFPFDSYNCGTTSGVQRTFPVNLERLLINGADGVNDYFDNMTIETYSMLYFRRIEYTGSRIMSVSEMGTSSMRLEAKVYDGSAEATEESIDWSIARLGEDFTGSEADVYTSGSSLCSGKAVYGTVYVLGRVTGTPGISTGELAITLEKGYSRLIDGTIKAQCLESENILVEIYAPAQGNFIDACLSSSDTKCFEKTVSASSDGSFEFSLLTDAGTLADGMHYIVVTNQSGKADSHTYMSNADSLLSRSDAQSLLTYDKAAQYLTEYAGITEPESEFYVKAYGGFDDKLQKLTLTLSQGDLQNYSASVLLASVLGGSDENLQKCKTEIELLGYSFDSIDLLSVHPQRTEVAADVITQAVSIPSALGAARDCSVLIGIKNSDDYYKNAKYYLKLINNEKYNNASSSQQDTIASAVAGKSFGTVDALNAAIDAVKLEASSSGSGKVGSSSSGGIMGYVPDIAEVKPIEASFSDVPVSHWCFASIEKLYEHGTVNGYGDEFRPEASVTRAEFVKMLAAAFEIESGTESYFDDVSQNDWFFPYVTGCARDGLVKGVGAGFFPNQNITRQDSAVIIHRFAINFEIELNEDETEFLDSSDIADYADDAVSQLAASDIVSGMGDGSFAPLRNLTRAEAAALIEKILTKGGLMQ